MRTTITMVKAREILDSRGNPTVEVEIRLEDGTTATAGVPSGASTGIHEALELRDGDKKRYSGKGVLKAVDNVNRLDFSRSLRTGCLRPRAVWMAACWTLDGTAKQEPPGSQCNSGSQSGCGQGLLPVAGAFRFTVILAGVSARFLPVPFLNILNGGVHANWQGPDLQEFMIAPVGAPSFHEALRWGSEIYQSLKGVIKARGYATGVGG